MQSERLFARFVCLQTPPALKELVGILTSTILIIKKNMTNILLIALDR